MSSWNKTEAGKAYMREYNAARKDQIREYNKKYREEHLEELRAYAREYGKSHSEETKSRATKWNRRNPAKRREITDRYYQKHSKELSDYRKSRKEAHAEYIKEWNKANKHKTRAYAKKGAHKRRALKIEAGGTYTQKDIQKICKKQGGRCFNKYCLKPIIKAGRVAYHIDHWMPLKLGGSNYPKNLRLLCPKCNLSKSDKHPRKWMADQKAEAELLTPKNKSRRR